MGLLARLLGGAKSRAASPANADSAVVRVAVARHQPEGDLLIALLGEAGIPAYYGRTRGFDVPDMLAAGPRDILVPAAREAEARAVLEPAMGDADGDESTAP